MFREALDDTEDGHGEVVNNLKYEDDMVLADNVEGLQRLISKKYGMRLNIQKISIYNQYQ